MKSSLVASGEILHSKLTNCRGFKECMIGQANGLAFSKVSHQNIFLPFRKTIIMSIVYLRNCTGLFGVHAKCYTEVAS